LPEAEHRFRLFKLARLKAHYGGPFLVEGEALRPFYRALDNHVMAMLIDVPYPDDRTACVALPFLGRTGYFPVGLARIAKRADAMIIPFYTFESRAGGHVRFHEPVPVQDMNETEITAHLVALLESHILQDPQMWWLWQALPLFWRQD